MQVEFLRPLRSSPQNIAAGLFSGERAGSQRIADPLNETSASRTCVSNNKKMRDVDIDLRRFPST